MHWLWYKSKAPIAEKWSTIPVMSVDELIRTYRVGYGLGIRLGEWSKVEGYGIVVLDFDINAEWERCTPYEHLYRFWDGPTLEVKSGSPYGHHFYFLCPLEKLPAKSSQHLCKSDKTIEVNGSTKLEWAVEVLSTGRQINAPPSLHPTTGEPYRWITDLDADLDVIPDSILHAIWEPVKAKLTPIQRPAIKPPTRKKAPKSIRALSAISVADEFKITPWEAILVPFGWHKVHTKGDRTYWRRPGKDKDISASTVGDVFYCFSTSTIFAADQGFSKFAVFAILEHDGNLPKAARHLLKAMR